MARENAVTVARAGRTRQATTLLRACTIPAALVLLASCSARSTSAKPSATGGGTRGTEMVQVVDTAFQPADLSVSTGARVVWTQSGGEPHSVSAADGSFDSSPDCSPITTGRCLQQGGSFAKVFDRPGVYRYYCRVHGTAAGSGMAGRITVKAG